MVLEYRILRKRCWKNRHQVRVLEAQGQEVVSPADRAGMHPLLIPLSKSTDHSFTGILRWPTSQGGSDMPVVKSGKNGITLVANSANEYIHRALVEVRT